MKTVDELKIDFGVSEDQELAAIMGKSAQAISNWRRTGVPAIAERQAIAILQKNNSHGSAIVTGGSNHIDIHHSSQVSEPQTAYSPALAALTGLAETLPEAMKWRLVKVAIDMKDEQDSSKN